MVDDRTEKGKKSLLLLQCMCINLNCLEYDRDQDQCYSCTNTYSCPIIRDHVVESSNPSLPKIFAQVLNFLSINLSFGTFSCLSLLDIDYSTVISSYFDDLMAQVHMVFLLPPQIGEPSLKKIDMGYLQEEAMMRWLRSTSLGLHDTTCKRRAVKLMEKLDGSLFVKRNDKISSKLDGFKYPQSTQNASTKPMPLAIIPACGTTTAPTSQKEIMEGIAKGFLQIQSKAISPALLGTNNLNTKIQRSRASCTFP